MIVWYLLVFLLWLMLWSLGAWFLINYAEDQNFTLTNLFKIRRCQNCKKSHSRKDQIPLLSFLIQKWKCRYCKKRLSYIYPILELWTAFLFVFVYRYFIPQGFGITAFWMLTSWLLLLMAIYDILWYEIHIPLLMLAIVILLWALLCWLFPYSSLRWGLILFLVFFCIYRISYLYVWIKYKVKEEWLWLWDVFISPYIGTLLFIGISSSNKEFIYFYVLFFLIITSLIWILFFLLQNKIIKKKATFLENEEMQENTLPLIPAMIISTVIMLIFQSTMFDWILSFFGGLA